MEYWLTLKTSDRFLTNYEQRKTFLNKLFLLEDNTSMCVAEGKARPTDQSVSQAIKVSSPLGAALCAIGAKFCTSGKSPLKGVVCAVIRAD